MHRLKGHVSPWIILVVMAVAWRLVYAYWTPVFDRYIVPPGDDAIFHITAIDRILHGHFTLFAGTYPLGFHYVAALFAKILGINGLQAAIWLTPTLIVLPIPVIYYVGSRFFKSDIAGAVAAAAWGILALGPIRALGDGNYSNLFASSILLPLAILSIYRTVQAPRPKSVLVTVGLLLAVAFTHHLSLVYLIAILMPWMVINLIEKVWGFRHAHRSMRKIIVAAIIGVGAVALLMLLYRGMVGPYSEALLRGQSLTHVFGADNKPLDLLQLLEINNPLLVILGLVGLLMLLVSKVNRSIKLLMACWLLIFIALATTPSLALQGRFAREIAVPCALAIGFGASQLVSLAARHRATLGAVFIIVAVLLADVLASFSRPFSLPDPFLPLMRVQHVEEPAYSLLDQLTPEGTVILAANSNPFLPLLVHHPVIVPATPQDLVDILRQPIGTVYIGARPALTDDYPYYQNYDNLSKALRAIPGLTVARSLPNGSTIYLYSKSLFKISTHKTD